MWTENVRNSMVMGEPLDVVLSGVNRGIDIVNPSVGDLPSLQISDWEIFHETTFSPGNLLRFVCHS